jgi:glycosyltransferase involved in cell wall biosynthesis
VFRIASDTDCDPQRVLVTSARERGLYHFGLRRADAILAQTEAQVRALHQHYGLPAWLAPMWVDVPTDDVAPAARDIDVLWVANLRALKRPELFVELARRLPHHRFHLVGGVAPKEPDVAAQVETLARAQPNLQCHGRLSYNDTLALFARARVFVSTSLIEGFPNTFLQAWAHGVPSVSYFDPDGVVARCGLGSCVDSLDALVLVVQRLLEQPQWHEQTRRACRAYMQSHYRADQLLAPYADTFNRLSGPPSPPPREPAPCVR